MTGDAEHFARIIGPVADAAVDLARLIHAGTGQMSYYSHAGELGFGFEAGAGGSLVIVVNWRGLLRLRILQSASPGLPRVVEPFDEGGFWVEGVIGGLRDLQQSVGARRTT